MKLIECYIENFGKLSAYKYRFSEGLNAFCTENGSGKTTLSVFIKAMFYGLGAERRQSLDENERKKYLPWQGGRYGGSLTFETGGVVYRIERSFGAKAADDSFSLVLRDTGELSDDYSENIGFELFDIDAQGFERTLFLSEKNLSGAVSNDSIAAKLSNLVGTTGDVGEISTALSRLEEKRKYYHKRGGSGEIASLRAKISECDGALTVLERRRLELEEKETRLKEIELAIAEVDREREEIADEMAKERIRASGRTYREQYAQMRAAIDADRASLSELSEFFASGIPTTYEIDEARDAMREAQRLRSERRDVESAELTELREFFTRGTDFSEIESVKSSLSKKNSFEAEVEAIRKNMQFAESELTDELGGTLPSSDELIKAIPTGKDKLFGVLSPIFAIISVGMFVTYFFVESVIFILLGALMLIASSLPALMKGDARKSDTIRRLRASLGNKFDPKALYERLLAHEAAKERDLARISELRREIINADEAVSAFIARYRHGADCAEGAIAVIGEKYKRYYALCEIAKQNESTRTDFDMRIEYFESKARRFTDKYKTTSSEPFEEIRSKLNAYNYVQMTLSRRESECRDFMTLHGIREGEEVAIEAARDMGQLELRLNAHKTRLLELRREQALIEREYNEALADVERTDEVKAAREALCDRLVECTEALGIITATADMLTKASAAITSRYIGGTKEKFLKYIGMLSGEAGEFAMGTDFVLKKFERGETRVAESYSRGMRDLHAFCLRIALSDSLYGGAMPFVILDDPFISLDNERLDSAKALIRELAKERQVIYFTCSTERSLS